MVKICEYFRKQFVAILISALLAALPLSFSWGFFLSWIGFVPFFVVVLKECETARLRTVVGRWVLFGFAFNFCIYYWFWWLYPLDFLGISNGMSIVIVVFAWLFVSLFHAAFYVIPGILCYLTAKKIKRPFFTVFAGVVGVLIALKLTEYGELAFPWVRISLGNYRTPVLIQSLSIWGVEGLDFLVLLINALVALTFVCKTNRRKIYAYSAVTAFTLNLVFGICRLYFYKTDETDETVTATVIQGNVLVDEKWNGSSAIDSTYELYAEMTKSGITDDTDIVIWPETAVPVNIARSERWQQKFKDLSTEIDLPIYMGVNWRPDTDLYNSAVIVDGEDISEPCSKRILVPIGEKIPYKNFVGKCIANSQSLDAVFTEYVTENGAQVMKTDFGKIGSVICFESIFPLFSREIAQNDGEMLCIITNDAWLEDSPAVEQHLAHSVFRSVENSKDTVRCANVGISAFIDNRGRITDELKPLERGTLKGEFNVSKERTFYNTAGYMFFPLLVISYAIICVIVYVYSRRKIREEMLE